MKILLVGEFSGLHRELKKGLVELGHHVTIFAAGDGWKNVDCDLKIPGGNGFFSKAYAALQQFFLIRSLRGYDVVQFIYPHIFNRLVNSLFISILIKQSKSSFLVAAGSDAYYWKDYEKKFRYSPHLDNLAIDLLGKRGIGGESWFMEWNKTMVLAVNAVIPASYDYRIGYDEFKNVAPTIPMPFDVSNIEPHYFDMASSKIVVVHGISRAGFKGSKFINMALDKLKLKHGEHIEIIRPERINYKDYLDILKNGDIVVDQALTYSYGMNALLSASMGKVTLSGAEKECLSEIGVENCPIINILPSVEDIYHKLDALISNPDRISQLSKESRDYVIKIHNSKIIASKYIKTWISYQ